MKIFMTKSPKSVIVIAICVLLGCAAAHEFAGDHTIELTASNYEEQVNNGKVFLIAYFAPWCGHCKRLGPTWKDLSEKVAGQKDQISIAYIDCTAARDICQKAEVKGYPTIKVIHKGEEYKTYQQAREVGALHTFITGAAQDLLTEAA